MYTPIKNENKGAIGLLYNNKVIFIIENKRIRNEQERWMRNAIQHSGLGFESYKVMGNNSPNIDEHHLCHAYAAYAQSGFDDASILVMDGMNKPDGVSIGIFKAKASKVEEVRLYSTAYSLGTMYGNGVHHCGFGSSEYAGKMMGASSYMTEKITDRPVFFTVNKYTGDIEKSDFQCKYNENSNNLFSFTNEEILKKACGYLYFKEDKFTFEHVRIAAMFQQMFEESVESLLEYMHNTLPSRNLIITGGCGLNCVMNGKIIRSGMWNDLFIPNMCEDQGNIIGRMVMELGQKVTKPYIYNNVTYSVPKDYRKKISKEELADRIHKGQIIAWFEGGSEYGPRALCHRSILAKPTFSWMSNRINEIKHREYWRPLAPVVLDTHFKTFFDVDGRIWYPHKVMLATEYIRPEWQRKIPAVCAPDNSSRPQVLTNCPENYTLYSLMKDYDLPILVNTSMNDAGQPICEYPEDAIGFTSNYKDVLLVFVKHDTLYIKE